MNIKSFHPSRRLPLNLVLALAALGLTLGAGQARADVQVNFDKHGAAPGLEANRRYSNVAVITLGGASAVTINGSSQPIVLVATKNGKSRWRLAITNLTGFNSSMGATWQDYGGPYPWN